MFWKVAEFFVRIVFFKRFNQAKNIGRAAKYLGQSNPGKTIEILKKLEPSLHPSLKVLFYLTKGRAFDIMQKVDEAFNEFETAHKIEPDNPRINLELAVIYGRKFDFQKSMELIKVAKKNAPDEVKERLGKIEKLVKENISGKKSEEIKSRAASMAKRIDESQKVTFKIADEWIDKNKDKAAKLTDELSILAGQILVDNYNASWKLSLALSESCVVMSDGKIINPFDKLEKRLSENNLQLTDIFRLI